MTSDGFPHPPLPAAPAAPGSSEQLSLVLASITDGFAMLDMQWRIVYMNPRALDILRPVVGDAAPIGRVHWEAFPDTVGTPLEQAYRNAMAEQRPAELELFYPPLNGWFHVRAFPSSAGLSIFFQDITARKIAEAALEAEKHILGLIARDAPLASTLDAIAREVEARSQHGILCSILLLSADGQRLLHGAAPSLPPAYNQAIDGIQVGPGVGSCGTAAFERRVVCVEDVTTHPYWEAFKGLALDAGLRACTSSPLVSPRGQVLGTLAVYYREARQPTAADERLIAVACDMACIAIERHRVDDELRRRAEQLRATFEQAAVGIATAELDGHFVEMNQKFCELMGFSQDELRRLTFHDITHPDHAQATAENVRRLLAGDTRSYSMQKRYVRRDGSTFWSLATITLLRDDAGAPKRFIGVVEDISAAKTAEAALRRSEMFSREIMESSQSCIQTLSLDGRVTWVSNPGLRALKLEDPASLLHRPWADAWEGEGLQQARDAVAAAARGEAVSFVGEQVVAGQRRWWRVRVTPILDTTGRPERLLAVLDDVTENVTSEQRLRESEAQWRLLANSIPQLAWMAEPDGHIVWYNDRWHAYTGKTLEEMQGWGWQSVHDPEMLPQVMAGWQQSLASGTPFEMEFPLRRADGQMRWFLTRVNPMLGPQGEVIRWFGTNTDIDEVRRIRQALQEESRMLELLNATGTTLATNLDLQALLQAVTDSATKLSGARFGAFFYNTIDDKGEAYLLYTLAGAPRSSFERLGYPRATPIFGPTFRGEGVVRCDDVLEDPRYGQMAPHHGMPAGHLPVRSYLAVPVKSRSGEVIGGLFFGHPDKGVFTERTERLVAGIAAQAGVAVDNARLFESAQRSAREREWLLESERAARSEAERASRMKDEFLATLSHELRTPLTAILGWSHLLRRRPPTPADVAKGMETIERNARLQTQLIDDLLDMSRITSGKLRLDVQSVRPTVFIEAAIDTVRPAALAKDIRLEAVLDPLAGPITGDPSRLQQVVWNLLTNAVKFTPRGGKVQVVLQRVNSHIEIAVADNGVGIPPEFLPHVFERFRQADASIRRHFSGLGLGLSIVKQLVELHGGTVQARSAGEGTGTTFAVHLPVAAIHRPDDEELRVHPRGTAILVAPAYRPVDLSGIDVLVVDDQPDTCELVARVITDCGASVRTVASARQALAALAEARPDVMVSDIGMPEMDGYELMMKVRSMNPPMGERMPAIAMTAFARSEDRTRALHSGFQMHITKPVEPSELIAAVASMVGRTAAAAPKDQ